MKVLLIGEFSGVHNNLKIGLRKKNVKVLHISGDGDSFKNFGMDLNISLDKSNTLLSKVKNKVMVFMMCILVKRFDVVQFIHPDILHTAGYTYHDIIKIVRQCKKVVLLACGCDYTYAKYSNTLSKSPCYMCEKYDAKNKQCNVKYYKDYRDFEKKFMKYVNIIVPCAYDYNKVYHKYFYDKKKIYDMIPLPLDEEKIVGDSNLKLNKNEIIIYHPLNRLGFKGTPIINKAFRILDKKYDKVKFVIKGRMPINEYEDFIKNVDIVVEQLNFMSYGMSAIYSMGQGKMIVTGDIDKNDKYVG